MLLAVFPCQSMVMHAVLDVRWLVMKICTERPGHGKHMNICSMLAGALCHEIAALPSTSSLKL